MQFFSTARTRAMLRVLLLGAALGAAQAQTLKVLNAASFTGQTVAPGSIVTIFGSNLTSVTASASSSSQPPITLGGTSVMIGGIPAALFYVSPGQINAVVDPATPAGNEPVVVTSASATTSGTVMVDPSSPPGLFSMTGTGTHDGAIINALTGHLGAFSTSSATAAEYLSIFLTGASFATPPVVMIAGVSVPVTYAGVSPCCDGLQQINLTLPESLEGAGRVPVTVQTGTQVSNVVEIVLLPEKGDGEFASDGDDEVRSREVAAMAYIPGTSLTLVADEDDDVVREIDIQNRSVVKTIAIASDAEAAAIAVNSAGTLAVVAERRRGKVALVDLASLTVTAEIAVGAGPVAVAISGNLAVVANGDNDNVSIVDLTAKSVVSTIAVGRGARGVAIDAAGHAWVTNQDDGTISEIDLTTDQVINTVSLGTAGPAAIQIVGATGFALVADPASAADGKVLAVNLTTSATTAFSVNPARSGGSGDIAVMGMTAYIANQAGGSISVLPLSIAGGAISGTPATVTVARGIRAVAVDGKDNLLLVLSEGSGKVALVDLTSDKVVAQIKVAVAESGEGDDDDDDHSDHDNAPNLPAVFSLSPSTVKAGATFTLTVLGSNLQGATGLLFVSPGAVVTQIGGHARGKGTSGSGGNGVSAIDDTAFSVTDLQVNGTGTQITATVAVAAKVSPGPRIVRVSTPNGDSVLRLSGDVLNVIP